MIRFRRTLAVLVAGALMLSGCGEEEPCGPVDVGVPAVPADPVPVNGAADVSLSPVLSWTAVAGATGYALQVSAGDSFSSFVYDHSNLTTTSRQVEGLNYGRTYYWRVRASNAHGMSAWSTPAWRFTTADPAPCPGLPVVPWGGKTYTTVLIGTQCWLRENLDIGIMVSGSENQTNNDTIEKYCYNDSLENCATYGGLYQWDEAMRYDTSQGAQGICPPGWHIPRLAEFETLRSAVGGGNGDALKAMWDRTGDRGATDASGFSALLGGKRHIFSFSNRGYVGLFSSSNRNRMTSDLDAYHLLLIRHQPDIFLSSEHRFSGHSVRCVKD